MFHMPIGRNTCATHIKFEIYEIQNSHKYKEVFIGLVIRWRYLVRANNNFSKFIARISSLIYRHVLTHFIAKYSDVTYKYKTNNIFRLAGRPNVQFWMNHKSNMQIINCEHCKWFQYKMSPNAKQIIMCEKLNLFNFNWNH